MSVNNIFVVGASGHAKVVLDALLRGGVPPSQIFVTDDAVQLKNTRLLGLSISFPAIQVAAANCSFHVAIGDGKARQLLFENLENSGSRPFSVMHPNAVISNFASIGAGAFVAAQGVIATEATIGRGTIINHGAIVDHDCVVGDFVHIAPNATLGGGVRIGDLALIGAGATILPQISIGKGATVGAGAVVLHDVAAGAICAGVPAATIRGR